MFDDKNYDWREETICCEDCKYFDLIADFHAKQGIKTPCKNMDYTKYWFYAPWFQSHCTGAGILICRQFEMSSIRVWLKQRFTCPDDYIAFLITHGEMNFHTAKVSFFKAGNRKEAKYDIYFRDFYYGTYENEDGTLKCCNKTYYKIDRKSPVGYRLIHEKQGYDLEIKHKTYLDILQEKYKDIKHVLDWDIYT